MSRRLVVVGLDCADPHLVFERYAHRMPTLSRLRAQGVWGPLQSTMPPITIPAWLSLFSGRDPGELGVYGFKDREDHRDLMGRVRATPERGRPRSPMIWDRFSQAGKTSFVMGVPGSYPPRPLRGRQLSGMLTPEGASDWSWPADLGAQVMQILPGGYRFDLDEHRHMDRAQLLAEATQQIKDHFRLAQAWAAEGGWDLLVLVEIALDRIQHAFFRHVDETHPRYEPSGPFAAAIEDSYALLDQEIGALWRAAGEDATLLVASDHGVQSMHGLVHLNQLLLELGLLRLKATPRRPTRLSPELVDWNKTQAFAQGGYVGRILLNLRGREPKGQVPPAQAEATLRDLASRLENSGQGLVCHWPRQLYRRLRGSPPDLLVVADGYRLRLSDAVGHQTLQTEANDTGFDDANHAPQGIYLCSRPVPGLDLPKPATVSILDLFGRMLYHGGLGTGWETR